MKDPFKRMSSRETKHCYVISSFMRVLSSGGKAQCSPNPTLLSSMLKLKLLMASHQGVGHTLRLNT